MKITSIDKENEIVICDNIEYPLMCVDITTDEFQNIVDDSETIIKNICEKYGTVIES